MLAPGTANALIFVATVLSAHELLAIACAKSEAIRHIVRGKHRALVLDGKVLDAALEAEGVS